MVLKKGQNGRSSSELGKSPPVFQKQTEVDLKDGFEESHVGTLVQADLVFPDVDNLSRAISAC